MRCVQVYSLSKEGTIWLAPSLFVKDFRSRDGTDVILIDMELVGLLDTLSSIVGRRVSILSGYRTPSFNQEVCGARFSEHLYGCAADIRVEGMSPKVLYEILDTNVMPDKGGLGLYPTFVHLDTRPKKSRWRKNVKC